MTPTVLTKVLRAARALSLGCTELHALCVLVEADSGSLTLAALAQEIGVTTARLTCLADSLEDIGAAERRHSRADRRSIFLCITAEGRRLVQDCIAAAPGAHPATRRPRPALGLRVAR